MLQHTHTLSSFYSLAVLLEHINLHCRIAKLAAEVYMYNLLQHAHARQLSHDELNGTH